MTSYDDWYPSNFFKADDVINNPLDLTIADIHPEKMQDGNPKPVVFFKEDKRGLVNQQKFPRHADAQQEPGRCCRPARRVGGGRVRVSGQAVHGLAPAPATRARCGNGAAQVGTEGCCQAQAAEARR